MDVCYPISNYNLLAHIRVLVEARLISNEEVLDSETFFPDVKKELTLATHRTRPATLMILMYLTVE